jgi:Caspase domain
VNGLKVAVLAAALAAAPALAETRRVAIVAGNNAGAGTLPPLRYAESDAGKMARVLVELGEVSQDDLLLLQGRRVSDIERAIIDARDRVQKWKANPDVRTVLVFFFSGHSDGESLEVGGEKLAYARLKALLTGTGADVRVTIVDACKSGGGIREKGGKPAAPFTIRLTDTLVASGDAFITSSAADEAALESSEVMGSVFTHNFISGLRGAADVSGDKLVTLAEAYRYAYDRTVASTSLLPVGVQHPNYDYKISGQGELVLVSLQKPSAVLVVPEGSERTLVTDVVRDQVLVELPGGGVREVAVSPGSYGVRLFKEGKSWGGRITIGDGARRVVSWSELTPTTSGAVIAKKGEEVVAVVPEPLAPTTSRLLSVSAGVSRAIGVPIHGHLRLGFEFSRSHSPVLGITGAFGNGTQGNGRGLTEVAGQLRLGYRFAWEWNRLWAGIGADAVAGLYFQSQPAFNGLPEQSGAQFAGGVAPRLSGRVRIGYRVSILFDFEVQVLLTQLDGKLDVLPVPGGTLGLTFDL